jgi:uncharacterized Fe-S center protein
MSSNVYFVRLKGGESDDSVNSKLGKLVDGSKVLKFMNKGSHAALKIHFGEKGNTGHINAGWLRSLVGRVASITDKAFFTDTNVLYKESERTNSVDHLKLSHEHGFGLEQTGVPVIIADGLWGRNFVDIKIGKKRFESVKIASDIAEADNMLALTHITGHIMTGFAGAIKNLGMGCASRRGKFEQHCGIVPDLKTEYCVGCGQCVVNCPGECLSIKDGKINMDERACIGCGECVVVCKTEALTAKWSETLANLQEKMVEYAYGAMRSVNGRAVFISFLLKVTKNCDCIARDEPAMIGDIGMLASEDPVAIDKASVDLINRKAGTDALKRANPITRWEVQVEYAERIGLGKSSYVLKEVA